MIDKPAGISSAKVVACVKSALTAKKAGHAGTLDPFATGLMLCCVNQATRLARFFLQSYKSYRAVLHLGVETDTQDTTGSITATHRVKDYPATQIRDAFKKFEGAIEQTPPVYSALKHNGVPLYKLARSGQPVRKPPRRVVISSIRILAIDLPYIHFDVSCSSGTYIRTLSADIGSALGCGAHLKKLRRTESSGFFINEATTLPDLEELSRSGEATSRLVPMADALRGMPEFVADRALAEKITHGISLKKTDVMLSELKHCGDFVKVIDAQRNLLAVLDANNRQDSLTYCCVFN